MGRSTPTRPCVHPFLRPSVSPSVAFCFLNILKSHCWIFIKLCKHVYICKTNNLDKKVRARGQFYTLQTLFVVGILFSRCLCVHACVRLCVHPSVCPSVTFCFLNILKSHCWISSNFANMFIYARQII